jgi:MFS family permease
MKPTGRFALLSDRRLQILFACQAITGATMPVLFLISGLMSSRFTDNLSLSTLPIALQVIGIAIASTPASLLMARLGRRQGHLLGLLITMTGVVVSGAALTKLDFTLLNIGSLLAGMGSGFNNLIRFSAAEGMGDQKALVHSWVLTFSLFAAIFGPLLTLVGHSWSGWGEYVGATVLLFGLLVVAFLLMFRLPEQPPQIESTTGPKPSLRTLLAQSSFWLGALTGMVSFATMTLIMSATPLQMHHHEHFSSTQTTLTIQSHIVAMFLPSLFSGWLLSRIGFLKLIFIGISLFAGCILMTFFNAEFVHYWLALVLLGVGWNFLFLAGSSWISISFSGPDRFLAQGANDSFVFSVQALASLGAGIVLHHLGWKILVLIPVPLLIGLVILIWTFHRQGRLKVKAQSA